MLVDTSPQGDVITTIIDIYENDDKTCTSRDAISKLWLEAVLDI